MEKLSIFTASGSHDGFVLKVNVKLVKMRANCD